MNRLFVRFCIDQFYEPDRCMNYLAYLQIRATTRNTAGGFKFYQFCQAIKYQPRAAKKILNKLISLDWVVDLGNENYHIVAHHKIAGVPARGARIHCVSDEKILSYSLKSIAKFRAFIDQISMSIHKNLQIRAMLGYTIVNQRDHSREKIAGNDTNRNWHIRASHSYHGLVGNYSPSTALKYRKLQEVSEYISKMVWMNKPKEDMPSLGQEMCGNDLFGVHFEHKGKIVFSPVSIRRSNLKFKSSY